VLFDRPVFIDPAVLFDRPVFIDPAVLFDRPVFIDRSAFMNRPFLWTGPFLSSSPCSCLDSVLTIL
jgi:hypothetical protein